MKNPGAVAVQDFFYGYSEYSCYNILENHFDNLKKMGGIYVQNLVLEGTVHKLRLSGI